MALDPIFKVRRAEYVDDLDSDLESVVKVSEKPVEEESLRLS
jgi:hypothetical protein